MRSGPGMFLSTTPSVLAKSDKREDTPGDPTERAKSLLPRRRQPKSSSPGDMQQESLSNSGDTGSQPQGGSSSFSGSRGSVTCIRMFWAMLSGLSLGVGLLKSSSGRVWGQEDPKSFSVSPRVPVSQSVCTAAGPQVAWHGSSTFSCTA